MPFEKFQWYFFLFLLLAVFVLTLFIARPFFNVLALAAVASVVLYPLYEWLKRRLAGSSRLAAVVLIVFVLLVVFLPLGFLIRQVGYEAASLYRQLAVGGSEQLASFNQKLAAFWPAVLPPLDLENYLSRILGWLVDNSGQLLAGTVTVSWKIIFWILALYYFLKDGVRFYREVLHLSPLADRDDEAIAGELRATVKAVVTGALLIAALQGTLVGIGFTLFGLSHAALWGSLAAVAALIPGVGTALVLIPGILSLWWQGELAAALGLLVWGAVMVGLIDNLLAPVLYGRGGKTHPLLILVAVVGGLGFFGPSGFILGPVTFSLLVALLNIYQNRLLTHER